MIHFHLAFWMEIFVKATLKNTVPHVHSDSCLTGLMWAYRTSWFPLLPASLLPFNQKSVLLFELIEFSTEDSAQSVLFVRSYQGSSAFIHLN